MRLSKLWSFPASSAALTRDCICTLFLTKEKELKHLEILLAPIFHFMVRLFQYLARSDIKVIKKPALEKAGYGKGRVKGLITKKQK